MKPNLRRRPPCYFLCAVPALLIIWTSAPTLVAWENKITILYALNHARSVHLEHYQIGWRLSGQTETVLGAKDLLPENFHKVSDAFPFLINGSIPGLTGIKKCLFDPHHRIIIRDGTGRETIIRVCFICDQYEINDGTIQDIPATWLQPLRRFFDEEGLPQSPDDH